MQIAEIDQMITTIREQNVMIDTLKNEQKRHQAIVDDLEGKIMTALEADGLKSFKGSNGAVSIVSRFSVKFPKDPAVKEEFRMYLAEQGSFDGLWVVNHQTLNSWYKAELEACQARGEMIDVPGLEPVEDKYLQVRKT